MKFCSKCGNQIPDEAVICVHCGCQVSDAKPAVQDAPSTGYAVLGFFFPLIGLVLYLVNKDTCPMKAKSAGKGALIGVIVSVIFSIIYGVLIGSMIGSMMYYY